MTRRSELPDALASRLFGLEAGCEILYYGSDSLVFEVFLTGWAERTEKKISHTCIEVSNRDDLLARASDMGFRVVVPDLRGRGMTTVAPSTPVVSLFPTTSVSI